MAPLVRKTYAITYNDGTYMTFDLTKPEYIILTESLTSNHKWLVMERIGVLRLDEVRSVIMQKEPEEVPEQTVAESAKGDPVEMMSEEDREWLRQMREAGITEEGIGGYV